MENLGIRELNSSEVEEVNGGFVFTAAAAISIVIAAAAGGYKFGSDRANRDNRND